MKRDCFKTVDVCTEGSHASLSRPLKFEVCSGLVDLIKHSNRGDEEGKIDGSGVVSGDFGNASLNGGSLVNAPQLKEKPKREGEIRMNIIVDSSGKVISAKFDGGLNSTFSDSEHIRLAEAAALSATFTADASRPRRSGFITIRFELE